MEDPRLTLEDRRFINRTGTKVCDICQQPEILVQHHLNGREVRNWNQSWNICDICDNCHRKLHINSTQRLVIEGWFGTTHGRQLVWRKYFDEPITGQESTPPLI